MRATPASLAVGLQTGSHGWVEVRADFDRSTGEVSARLLASSPHAAAELTESVPALQQFLHSEQVQLGSLSVQHQPSSPALGMDSGQMSQGQTSQENRSAARTSSSFGLQEPDEETPLSFAGERGGWLHVIA